MWQIIIGPVRAAVVLLSMAVLVGCVTTQTTSTPTGSSGMATASCPAPQGAAADAAILLSLINAERAKAGVGSVRLSPALSAVAQGHACDNAARSSTSHTGSDGSDLSARLRRGGVSVGVAAENTGLGFASPEAAFAWWMASPAHRANILLGRITEIGVGQAEGAKTAWVINFAQRR